MKKRLYIAVPTDRRGALDAALTRWLLTLPKDIGWDYEISVLPKRPVVGTRNATVKAFLASDCDIFLTIDDDMVPEIRGASDGGLQLMLESIERDDVDLLTGIYLKIGTGGPVPILSKFINDERTEALPNTELVAKKPGLYPIPDSATGAGVLMFTRKMAEEFLERGIPWFKDVFCWDKDDEAFGERLLGQDIWLFKKAQELGFKCWMDTRIHWGHIKACDLRSEWLREQSANVEAMRLNNLPYLFADTCRELWGNEDWTLSTEALVHLLLYTADVPPEHSVVECGGGISTLALSKILTPDRLVSLEHDEKWRDETVRRAGYLSEVIQTCALEDKGEYDWYGKVRWPDKPVGLLVVDGPPGAKTRGGRSGAIEEAWDHLAPTFRIFMDDIGREREAKLMEKWCEKYNLRRMTRKSADGRDFAILEGTK